MYAVQRIGDCISAVSGPFHPFGGAVDIIVVEQQDGSFKTSPWYVRFGKFQGVLNAREKKVKISVNGVDAGFSMYLDGRGEAFFLRADDSVEAGSVVSPPSSGDEMDAKLDDGQVEKNQNLAVEGSANVGSKAVVTRTNSRRSTIFGFMFGGKPNKDQQDNIDRRNSIERAEIAADLLDVKWSTNISSDDRMYWKKTSGNSELNVSVVDKGENSDKTSLPDGCSSAEVYDEKYSEQLRDKDTLLVTVKEEITVLHTSEAGNLADITTLASDITSKNSVIDYEMLNTNKNSISDDSSVSHGEILDGSNWNNALSKTCSEGALSNVETVEIYSGDKTCGSDIVSDIIEVETREVDIAYVGSDIYCGSKTEFDGERLDVSVSKDCTLEDEHDVIKSTVNSQRMESSSINLHEARAETSIGMPIPSREPQCCNIVSEPSNDISNYSSNLHIEEFNVDDSYVSEKPPDGSLKNGSLLHLTATIVSEVVDSTVTSEQTSISLSYSPDQHLMSSESGISCLDRTSIDVSQQNEPTMEQLGYSRRQPEIEEKTTMVVSSFPASVSSAPFSETMDEIQFSFSDCDSFSGKEVESELSNDDKLVEEEEEEDDLTHTPASDTKVDNENCQNAVPPLENVSDVMQSRSNPVNIPGNELFPSAPELSAQSLPVLRSDIDDIEGINLHYPLSCSLDVNSDTSELDVHKKNSISSYSLVESGNNFVRTQISSVATVESMVEENKITLNANVELSLCKHLLYKGMGAEAARRAFDAEKVNLEKFHTLAPSLVKNNKLVVKFGGYYFPWDAAAPFILGMVSFGQDYIFEPRGMIPVEGDEQYRNANGINTTTTSGGSWSLWPFSLKRSRSTSTKEIPTQNVNDNVVESSMIKNSVEEILSKKVKMVRCLTPTSEELASLNLKEGRNIVTFSFLTPMLGLQKVDANIYLWKWNTRIVISDVDGTITKSDVLGQFMPLVGVDWSQSGVAHLFCAIKENGYQLLFLSARAISQAHLTRQFLFNLKQDGKALPDGPVVISPDGLFPSLYREVIRRAPHEFKISCLEAIKALFPPDCNPFYAGFGNRDTDEISYLKVGIPLGKIFIINPKGQVAVNRQVDTRSYTSLHELVNGMFPPTTSEQEDYNQWNYWKVPPLEIDL